jgi:hypothetical protein
MPRTSRSQSTVEASRRAGLVRVGAGARSRRPVKRASYEADWIRGRGGPPFIAVSIVLVFLLTMDVGTPVLLVPTQIMVGTCYFLNFKI